MHFNMTEFEEYIELLWYDYLNNTNEFEKKYKPELTKRQEYNRLYYLEHKDKYKKYNKEQNIRKKLNKSLK